MTNDKPYSLQESIEILGKRWKLKTQTRMPNDRMADCDDPSTPGKTIRIQAGLPKHLAMRCLIHEMTHGAFWCLDEMYVEKFAEDLERELVRNGFIEK